MLGPQWPYPITPTRSCFAAVFSGRNAYRLVSLVVAAPIDAGGAKGAAGPLATKAVSLTLIRNSCLSVKSPQEPRRVSCDDAEGRHVLRDDGAGSDDGALADRDIREDRRARSDRGPEFHDRGFDPPVLARLQLPLGGRRAGIGIVGERDVVADEDLVFDRHALADERVARDLAPAP